MTVNHDNGAVALKWTEPLTFAELLWPEDLDSYSAVEEMYLKSGVYVYEEKLPTGYAVTYVGKADNLYYRQLQHYWYQLGGAYRLPKSYRGKGKEDWGLDLKNPDVRAALRDVHKFQQLVEQNFKYLKDLRLHLAPCVNTAVVERNLIWNLRKHPFLTNKRGTKTEPPQRCKLVHVRRQWSAQSAELVDK